MYFVYVLESENQTHWYVGITDDIARRLAEHNTGQSIHTNKYRPWNVRSYVAFEDEMKARAFERYLKSHSGRAFAKKHF
ncbi:GIY-YIG nuclease family protein [Candidatus Peregrinibacteria bacterium]|nr:GIY-YIG nuclease family protein [Candidatus Peregrinibacteria bacterium]